MKKIKLTEILPSDKATLVQLLSDKEIYNNTLRIPYPYTEENAEDFLSYIKDTQEKMLIQRHWAIRFKSSKELIGVIGVEQPDPYNSHRNEIGYWLGKNYRGQGIMTDAICVLCEQLFEERKLLHRLQATVYEHNPASGKVLEKAGFTYEGMLKDYVIKDGIYLNVKMYARLRS
ncbi:GNAT family N-acetyltransferase [Flammeovirgaceae bacterium SG7u.111]|nr:GNAT family N-acetyltransferase [Flammeovirgaceae bacterium SG7u.132]WPO38104.1 GNAT family N-acetyltransferase [Flammeovirgaceae bacterium SG7u.111]